MESIKKISVTPDTVVGYNEENYLISRILDFTLVLLKPSSGDGPLLKCKISDLKPPYENTVSNDEVKNRHVEFISDMEWKVAEYRYSIIEPFLSSSFSGLEVKEVAKANNLHLATIYRWLTRFKKTQQLSSLVPSAKDGGKGISRLSEELELLIKLTIEEEYLTKQKKKISSVIDAVKLRCHNSGLKAPGIQTVRRRINSISEELKIQRRQGKEVSRNLFEPLKAKYNEAKTPLHIVQIDHTKLDIILVDEVNRRALHRPWITLAFDVYSRMVVGIYISFDPPGALGTGMCLANAILPKEILLGKYNVEGEWPCWGPMKTIHADNAKEFRGSMLKRVAREYGINLEWREVKRPNWGGHIERYLGTLLREIQTLPGTTFSNIADRKTYNSEKEASLTIKELESWIITFIVNVYHKRFHSGIKMSPLQKYNEGIFGSEEKIGTGVPTRIFNERKVKLDFMPYVERSIQEYGVQIDHIYYYDDKLRPFINTLELTHSKFRKRRKFIFKRDPRDISQIYFYHPDLLQYFEIPYRDASHPPITIWEYRETERWLKEHGVKEIDERAIFSGYNKMKEIEGNAVEKTRVKRRLKKANIKSNSMEKSLKQEFFKDEKPDMPPSEPTLQIRKIVKPFDEIDI
ncbi:MAG: Mu transposase C-terminal domain-containing protein [Bacteroidia bacterium]